MKLAGAWLGAWLIGLPAHAATSSTVVTFSRIDGGIEVLIGGRPFTTYRYENPDGSPIRRPYLHPVLAADGTPVTSDQSLLPGGDHPHHRSVWVGHGALNDADHWSSLNPPDGFPRQATHGSIDERADGTVSTRIDWYNEEDSRILHEIRVMTFGEFEDGSRYIDMESEFSAIDGQVRIGDTKEAGLVAVRVAPGISTSPVITASTGCRGESGCWGKPAEWCDISGSIAGTVYGVTVMCHPENDRYPSRWHVREYGLLAANPWSSKAFGGPPLAGNGRKFEDGASTRYLHRIMIHRGTAAEARVADVFDQWSGTNTTTWPRSFDGLLGWDVPDPNPWWSIEGGHLIGRQDPAAKGHILESHETYRDVIVDLEYRYSGDVDSGVFLRAGQRWQCQIGVSRSLQRDMTGSIYDAKRKYVAEATSAPALNRIGEWNRLRLEARGDRFRHWLNGTLILDYTDPAFTGSGPVGLQLHPGVRDMKIEFRNIRVLRLEPPPPAR